ncbi:MAG TPA: PP2C family protein-serine/threonine phosphatase [Solirubrobacteraceae bacterium]|nr:PP2C family protein-serine/threonine phosphatase [Solirubrobacteraceae bacterium]
MADANEGVRASDVAPRARQWPYWAAVAVAVVGLLVTGVLTWVSAHNYHRNENRLLALRAHDLGSALTSALPGIQTDLASAAALADATGGNVAKFNTFVAPYAGTGRQFVSISLWRLGGPDRTPVAVAGVTPTLPTSSVSTPALFQHAAASGKLTVIGFLTGPIPRIGYAFTGMSKGPFAVYAESVLPPSRYAPPQKGAAFTDLNYALYLGASTNPRNLLIASVRHLPLPGRHATVKVPFGDTVLTTTVAARGTLTGSLPQRLPWAIAIGGVLLTILATALTVRLIERRRATERLAGELEVAADENRRLYAEQRGIAQTLQHALLPASLPQFPGLQISARYEAGAEGVEIGGDWYDVIELGDGRLLLVVGDVSGKGLPAATAMATLRFAIHAYAVEGDDPATFLPKLSGLISVYEDKQLATVLCAVIDPRSRQVTLTSAGHLPPLIIAGAETRFLDTPVGLPVGVDRAAAYASVTVSAPPGATFLAYTDGLVERRGETIEVGLERLRAEVSSNHVPLDQLLGRVLDDLRHDAPDDTAIAGIRWLS